MMGSEPTIQPPAVLGGEPAAPPVPVLAMRGITKTFPGVRALSNVDLDVLPGEVHALMGENGAGKSTLMKIVSGVYQPDAGSIRIAGQPIEFAHPQQAQSSGVSIIHQEFNLLPERTVAQNIFLGREPGSTWHVDNGAMEAATQRLLESLGMHGSISPGSIVGRLSVAQQQTIEIAKALSFDARIVVMDEPTASLSPTEVDALFRLVRSLQDRGIAFVYISHRIDEVMDLSQRITVLKDGQLVGTVDTKETTPSQLVSMMVGRELASYYPDKATASEAGEPVLTIEHGANGRLREISLSVRRGEVVGVAGLEGAGRTELARAIFGVEPFLSGSMALDGKAVRITRPQQAIRSGIGFLTEDRKSEGLILPQNVRDNALLALRSIRRLVGGSTSGGSPSDVIARAQRVDLRASGLDQEVRFLSGGNQQKVVLMKWLATGARLFIFDEPTRGIDVGAKANIHELMRELARAGAGILMISSELPEVIGMSDRILVMRQGQIAEELPSDPTEAEILRLATGESVREQAA